MPRSRPRVPPLSGSGRAAARRVAGALRAREGEISLWMALAAVGVAALGAFAVDTSQAFRVRAAMQAAADAAALAAIQAEARGEDPTEAALAVARRNLADAQIEIPTGKRDVRVGGWTPEDGFDPEGAFRNAVEVSLHSTAAREGPEPRAFMRILGLRSWKISARAVAGTSVSFDFDPAPDAACAGAGMTAGGTLRLGAGADLTGVCLHGEAGVEIGPGARFAEGARVSAPAGAPAPQDAPRIEASGLPAVAGTADALITGFALNATPIAIENWRSDLLKDGDRWHVHCRAPARLILPAGVYQNVQVTTNCALGFAGPSQWVNSMIGTTDDSAQGGGGLDRIVEPILFPPPKPPAEKPEPKPAKGAKPGAPKPAAKPAPKPEPKAETPRVHAPSDPAVIGAENVYLGDPDDCAEGGGTLLVVDGSVAMGPRTGLFGSTVIASGPLSLGDAPLGIEGAALLAGGDMTLPSGAAARGCGGPDWRLSARRSYRLLD